MRSDLDYNLEIHNLGQTPASILGYAIQYRLPPGWRLRPRDTVPTPGELLRFGSSNDTEILTALGEVAQRSFITSRGSATFLISQGAWEETQQWFANLPKGSKRGERIKMLGTLKYRDVFGDEHTIEWCWDVQFYFPSFDWPLSQSQCGLSAGLP
jgi:hypothetical protein